MHVEGVGVMKEEDTKFENTTHRLRWSGVREVIRGEWIGEGVDVTLLSDTLRNINFADGFMIYARLDCDKRYACVHS